MSRLVKNLIILSLAAAVVTAGGWYWYSSAKEVQAKVPQNAARISDIVAGMGDVANTNLSDFGSLSEISDAFRDVGGDNATMEDMATWLDTFGQMGGGVEDLLDGNYRNLGDVVTGLGQITDLGGATDILNSLGDLGVNIDDILDEGIGFQNGADLIANLSEMTNLANSADIIHSLGDLGANVETLFNGGVNFDSISDLFGALNEVSDYDLIKRTLDDFKKKGGTYDDIATAAANNGEDVGTIIKNPNVTSEELPPPGSGDGSQTQPRTIPDASGGRTGIGKDLGNDSKQAEQKLQRERQQDEKECKAETDFDDVPLDSLTGGINYVPVQEQKGKLLSLTEDTNELTSEIKDLQVQICTHLKTIKRVQLNFEDKEFVGDVKAREEVAERLKESQKQTLQLANEGRTRADGTDGASYATDVEELVKERVQAAAKITTTQVGNSGSAFAPELKAYLTAESERSSIDGQLASTLSREQYKELTDRSKVTELDHDSLWSFILKAAEPQNRPDGAMMIAREAWMVAQAKAEDFAIAELVANNGFASNRECVEEDDDGNCISWKVKSPGSVIGRAVEEATQLDNQLTLAADEASDLSGVEEPGISEAENLEQNNDSSGGPGGGGGGPVGGGGQAPGGQGDNDDFDLDGILNMFDFDIDDDGTDNDNDRDNFTIPDFGFPIDWGNLGGNRAPSLTFKLTGPTLEQIYEGRPNVGTISWKAQNADKCVARNNWLSSSLIPNRVESVKTANQTLETSGSLITYLPLTFDLRLERTRGNQTVIIPFATTTSAALTQQVTSITLNNSEVAVGDRFSLVAKVGLSDEAKVTIETNVASAGAVNSLLGSALTSLSASSAAGQEFGKYRITFTANESGTAFITITADPIYSIRCTNGGRNTDKTITVSRGN